jgi:hypothetical protein
MIIIMASIAKLYYCIYKNPIVHPNISVDENCENVCLVKSILSH